MKFNTLLIIAMAVIMITGCGKAASTSDTNSLPAIKKEFEKRTVAQQAEYFKTLKGTEVTWSGEVYNAFVSEIDKTRHVVVRIGKASDFASFTLNASDKTDITTLNRGDAITIKGELSEQGSLLTSWMLTNATVVK